MKKLLNLVLCLALIMTMIPANALAQTGPGILYWLDASTVESGTNLGNANWNSGPISGKAVEEKEYYFAAKDGDAVIIIDHVSLLTVGDDSVAAITGDDGNGKFKLEFRSDGETWIRASIDPGVFEQEIIAGGESGEGDGPGNLPGQIYWAEANKVTGNVTVDSLKDDSIWHTRFGAQPGVKLQVYFVAVENDQVVWINEPDRISTTNSNVAKITGNNGSVLSIEFNNSGEAVFSTKLNDAVYELPVTVEDESGGNDGPGNLPGVLYWIDAENVTDLNNLGSVQWNSGNISGEAVEEKEYYFAAKDGDAVIIIDHVSLLTVGDDSVAAITGDDGNGKFKLEFRSAGETWIRASIDPGVFEQEIIAGGESGGGDGPGNLPGSLYWAFAENVANESALNNPENWNKGTIQAEAGTMKSMCFASIVDGVVTVVNNPSNITFGDRSMVGIPGGSNHKFDLEFKAAGQTWMRAAINGADYEVGITITGGNLPGQIYWAEASKVTGNVTVDSLKDGSIWHTNFGAQPGVTLQVYFVAVENDQVVWINEPDRISTTNANVAKITGNNGSVLSIEFNNSGEAVFRTKLNDTVYELPVTVEGESGGGDGPGNLPGSLYWAFAENVANESALNNPENWNKGTIQAEAGTMKSMCFASIVDGVVTVVNNPSNITFGDRSMVGIPGGSNHKFDLEFKAAGQTWMRAAINGADYEVGITITGNGGGNDGPQQDAGPVRLFDSKGNLLEDKTVFLSKMEEGTFYFALVMGQIPENLYYQIEDKYNSMADGGYNRNKGLIDLDAGIITVTPVNAQDNSNAALIAATGLKDTGMQYQLFKAVVDNKKFKENTYLETGYMQGWIYFGEETEGEKNIFMESDTIGIFSEDFQPEPWTGENADSMYFAEAEGASPANVKLLKMYEPLGSEENAVYLMTGKQMTPETLTAWLTYEHPMDYGTVTAYQQLPEDALTLERGMGFYRINFNSFYGHNDILLQAREGDSVAKLQVKKAVQYRYMTDGVEMLEDVHDYLAALDEKYMNGSGAQGKILGNPVVSGDYATRLHASKGDTRSGNRPYNGGYFSSFLEIADGYELADIKCTGFDGEDNPTASHLFYLIGQNFYFLAYNPNGSMRGVEDLYQTDQNLQVSSVRGSYAMVETSAVLAEYVYNEKDDKYGVWTNNSHMAVAEALKNLKTWADEQGYEISFVDASMFYDIGISPGSDCETIDEFYEMLDQVGTIEFVTEKVRKNDAHFGGDHNIGFKASDRFSGEAWGEDFSFNGFMAVESDEVTKVVHEAAITEYFENCGMVNVLNAYDLQMEENAGFRGMVDVYVPIPEGVDPEICQIYWMHEGTPVPMPCRYVDGYMVFTTSHFSQYVLAKNPVAGFCVSWNGETVPDGGTLVVKPGELLLADLYYGGSLYEGQYPLTDSSDEDLIDPGVSPDGKTLEGRLNYEAQEGDSCWIEIYYGENRANTARFKIVAGKPDPVIRLKVGETFVRPEKTFTSNAAETTVELWLGDEKVTGGCNVYTNGNSAVCEVIDNGNGTFKVIANGNGECNIFVDYNGMNYWYTWKVKGMENAACDLKLSCFGTEVLPGGTLALAGNNTLFTGNVYCNGQIVRNYSLVILGPPGAADFGLRINDDGSFTINTPEEDGYTQLVLKYEKNDKTYNARFDVQVQTPKRYVFQFHTVEPDGQGGYETFGYATMSVFKKWSQEKYYKFVITDENMRRIDREHFVAATPENLKLYVYDKKTGEYIETDMSPFTITAMEDGSGVLKITYNRWMDFNGPAYMLKFVGEDKYLDNEAGIPTDDSVFIWTKSVREMAEWKNFEKNGNHWRYNGKSSKHGGMHRNDECDVKQTEIVIPGYYFGDDEETQIKTGESTMEVETDLGSITFDEDVLTQISGTEADITLSILDVEPEDEEYKNLASALGNASCIVDLNLSCGDSRIHQFEGMVTVRLPYVLSEEGQAEGRTPYVYYIDQNGNKHLMKCEYDAEKCEIWFVTNHFSLFEVEEHDGFGEPTLLGDVNLDGEVSAEDLTVLARHVAGIESMTDARSLANADVLSDDEINSDDLTRLARYVAGIITNWNQE